MKKLLLSVTIVLFLSSVSQAQLLRSYGVKFGTTLSSQDWQYSVQNFNMLYEPDSKIAFNAGLFAEFLNNDIFSVITEINYIETGAEEEMPVTTIDNPDGIGATIKWDVSIKYLSMSLLAKARLNMGNYQPYVAAGPYLDLQIDKSADIESFNTDPNMYGIKAGIGSEISSLLPFDFLVELMYKFDFDSVYKTAGLEITSKMFELRVGIML